MRYYGQFSPEVDRFIYERYFKSYKGKGRFIECGAFDGVTESSCKFFEESLGWCGYNIEASPKNYGHLCINRPASNNFHYGLSNFSGSMEFTDVIHPSLDLFGNGSLSHTEAHLNELDDKGCSYEVSVIPIITYKEFVALTGIDSLQLMVLDIEGHEIEALEGFRDAVVLPEVLCIEHGHLGVEGLKSTLIELGYVYDVSSHVNSFYILKPFESLYKSLIECQESLNTAENKNLYLSSNLESVQEECIAFKSSWSWRLTAPLRTLKRHVNKFLTHK